MKKIIMKSYSNNSIRIFFNSAHLVPIAAQQIFADRPDLAVEYVCKTFSSSKI